MKHIVGGLSCISVAVARALHLVSTGLVRLALLPVMIFVNSAILAAQDSSPYSLPAGTRLRLKMDVELNSHVASVGDTFTATVAKPLMNRGVNVLPAGTMIEGRVASVTHASTGGVGGSLDVIFERLAVTGTATRTIDATLAKSLSKGASRGGLFRIIGGTVIGAVFGGLTGSGRGALIGAGIGAGAGTGLALARRGRDVRIAKGEEFEIVLRKEVVLPVVDY